MWEGIDVRWVHYATRSGCHGGGGIIWEVAAAPRTPPLPSPSPFLGTVLAVPAVIQRMAAEQRGGGSVAAPAWVEMSASERFARAFMTMRSAFGGQAAFSLWVTVANWDTYE